MKYSVDKIILFGSRARPDFNRASDVDLAIFSKELKPTDFLLMHDDLEDKVSTPLKLNLVHFESLQKTSLKEEILKEGVCLYDSQKD